MPRIVLLAPLLLGACATAQPTPPVAGDGRCRDVADAQFVGREATSAVGAELLRASGARVLRWVQPGMMVTMDFREDRLTVWLAAGNRIERVNCG